MKFLGWAGKMTWGLIVLESWGGGCVAAHAQPTGIATEVTYIGETAMVAAGGLQKGVFYLDNLDVKLALDADSLIGWRGASAVLHGLANQGQTPTEWAGDAQGTSNIEAPTSWRLYEAWVEQEIGETTTLRAGLYDVNSEFDVLPSAALFFNSSHGMGPDFSQSGENGPSTFPFTALAVRAQVRFGDRYLRVGVLDGVPGNVGRPVGTQVLLDGREGLLLVGEVGWERSEGALAKVAVGGWHYTAGFETLALVPETARNNVGVYALGEVPLWREADGQGAQGFLRLGWAQPEVNRFGAYTGGGVVFTGLLPGRDADRAGCAVAVAYNGGPYKRLLRQQGIAVEAAEIVLEATYSTHLSDFLSLAGDVQYVVNPNTDARVGNALVVALRVGLVL